MSGDIITIKSLSHLHQLLGFPKPKHPLISVIDAADIQVPEQEVNGRFVYDFYMISMKDKSCGMEYGRNSFDFAEGVMIFSAPGQVYTPTRVIRQGEINGWLLCFHPDLIRNTHLAGEIDDYSFFNYDVYEALHLSEAEEKQMNECVANIQTEYEQRIDKHSRRVIIANLELILNYCLRFYERQFHTRTTQSRDVVAQFENELKSYFHSEQNLVSGLPSIQYFADKVHLSAHYFSDLLKKETGRSAKDHINDFVIEKAKNLLQGSAHSISEIAYDLGFNYPHYFTRLFKAKTGRTPQEYRNLN